MRVLLPLLILAAAIGAAPPPPDAGIPRLAADADADAAWVPFTLTQGNQPLFTATLDGAPVAAILDTGASQSLVTRAYAARTGRTVAQRGRVVAIGGSVATGWTAIGSVAFGGLSRGGGGLAVVDLPGNVTGQSQSQGRTVELLVGRDLLDRFALDIDYAAHRFRLLPSGRLPFAGTSAPLSVGHAPLAYVTQATIAGRRVRPLVVDTGDGSALTLARDTWRRLPLDPAPALTTQLAYGAGGTVVADIGTLPAVALGDGRVDDVPVWVEQTGGFSDRARAAGRIGSGLLQRYRVLLDPGAGRMVLAANGAAAAPRSTGGLQLALAKGELRVLHVMRGGPAAAAGWRAGERICAVDGARVAADPAAAARGRWLFAAPGTTVTLDLCDGTRRQLVTRRFY